jgi:uncharacterized protein (TIGR02452 family)
MSSLPFGIRQNGPGVAATASANRGDGLPDLRVGPIPEQKTRLAEARNSQLGYFYSITTYRDAFCTPFPGNPPITSRSLSRNPEVFSPAGRYNAVAANSQRPNNLSFGGSLEYSSGALPTSFRPPSGPMVELVTSGAETLTRSLRPPPGSAADATLWTTPDPRWAFRRDRAFGTATPEQLRRMAAETVAICREGGYQAPSGRAVEIREQIQRAVRGAVLYRPDHECAPTRGGVPRPGAIVVAPESVCEACKRLIYRNERIAIVNFASPSKPGGDFLAGRRGQEESLARASALYPTIVNQSEMYRYALANTSPLGSDYMIYSPDVPFFREDSGELMEQPFLVSVITASAVQASKCAGRPELEQQIRETMKKRIRKIIHLAILHGHRILSIGAFGCGSFGNDPYAIAQIEKELLVDEGLGQFFDVIVNPIDDGFRYQNYEAFSQVLAQYSDPK